MVFVDANDRRLVDGTPASGAVTCFDPPERAGTPMVDSGTLVRARYAHADGAGIFNRRRRSHARTYELPRLSDRRGVAIHGSHSRLVGMNGRETITARSRRDDRPRNP